MVQCCIEALDLRAMAGCRLLLQIPESSKAYLLDAEEEAKARKSQKSSTVWDDKMKATQTESAFGVRVC
jgi:hypothetical protein